MEEFKNTEYGNLTIFDEAKKEHGAMVLQVYTQHAIKKGE